jgi:hypothetical protein
MTAPFLLDEMSEESACLAGRSTYVALHRRIVLTRMAIFSATQAGVQRREMMARLALRPQ